MQRRVNSISATCFGVAFLSVTAGAQGAPGKPNVIIFLTDDQGWTGTSVQMDPAAPDSKSDFYETPALEGLAAQGMRFTHAYSPAAICSPSRASLHTGKSPAALQRTKNTSPSQALPAGITTLPQAIKAADPSYITGHFGKWHLDSGGPGSAGYDVHDNGTVGPAPHDPDLNPKDIFGIADRTEAFIRDQHTAVTPFVALVSQHAPHLYLESRPATLAKYNAKTPGVRHDDPGYAAMTEDLDAGLTQTLALLDELGIAQDTYVIFVSDNGGVSGPTINNNLPLAHGKAKLWEGGVRVPLVVRGPGIAAGSVSEVPTIGWDILPTVLDLIGAGASVPAGVEGGSIRSVLEDPAGQGSVTRPGSKFVWHYPHWRVPPFGNVTPHSAIQVQEPGGLFKLIRVYATATAPQTLHLYNLTLDPGETNDISSVDPTKAADYHQMLEAYLASVGAQLTPDPKPSGCGFGSSQALLVLLPLSLSRLRRRHRRG